MENSHSGLLSNDDIKEAKKIQERVSNFSTT
jgi:hypothetical protein